MTATLKSHFDTTFILSDAQLHCHKMNQPEPGISALASLRMTVLVNSVAFQSKQSHSGT